MRKHCKIILILGAIRFAYQAIYMMRKQNDLENGFGHYFLNKTQIEWSLSNVLSITIWIDNTNANLYIINQRCLLGGGRNSFTSCYQQFFPCFAHSHYGELLFGIFFSFNIRYKSSSHFYCLCDLERPWSFHGFDIRLFPLWTRVIMANNFWFIFDSNRRHNCEHF